MNRYEVTIIALFFFLLMSVRTSNLFFAGFAILVILILTSLRWWRMYMHKHVTAHVTLHSTRIFPGETVTGELVLVNGGRIPAFGIELSFDFWDRCVIDCDYLEINDRMATGVFHHYEGSFNLGAREKRKIPLRITGNHRGAYSFKGIHLQIKDPFGLDKMEKEQSFFEELLVYPSEIELQNIAQTHRMAQGDTVVRRWVHDDPFFPVGARPYALGDSFSRIDFKASAKLQSLHTKQYDYTAHGDICVVANLLTSPYSWQIDEQLFERTLSAVARIARESLHKDLRLSFFTNARMGKGVRAFEIPSGSGKVHYRKILEVLGRFSFFHATPFHTALTNVRLRYPNGVLTVVISPFLDAQTSTELLHMLKQGSEIYYIDASQKLPTIERFTVANWEEVSAHA